GALAGRAFGKVGRPQEPVLPRREIQRVALVPHMIARSDDIRAGLDGGIEYLFGDTEAASRVLAIDDDEIEPEIGNEAGKLFPNCRAAGLADHVAEKKKSHGRLLEHFSAKWNPVAHIETVKIVRLAEAMQ